MIKSWLKNLVSELFGQAVNPHQVAGAYQQMENTFGRILVEYPENGGPVRAFFEKQVLLGDPDKITGTHSGDGSWYLDMPEAVGVGRDGHQAVLHLWHKMTSLSPSEWMLQHEETIRNGEPHARYAAFRYREKMFQYQGIATHLPPPDRADEIALHLMRIAAEEEVFGAPTPRGGTRLWCTAPHVSLECKKD